MNPRLRAVARASVRTVNTPLARRRMDRALAGQPRPLNLEIGGLKPREGWLVTNVNALARNYLDATSTWPLVAGDVANVYADNVIEHIPLEGTRALLAEAHRCMRPGGVIRLITPDVRAHVELYLAGRESLQGAAAQHYRGMGLTVEHPIDVLRIPIGEFGHHTGYVFDFETLAAELTDAGFRDVVQCPAGQSEHEVMAGLDVRSHEGGAQLAVEAVR